MTALRLWWRARTRREQALIGVAAAIALPVLLWLALLRPLAAVRAAAEDRLATAEADIAAIAAMTASIRAAEARVSPDAGVPIAELVARRVADAGLTAGPVASAENGAVALRIAVVRAPVLLAWIAALERDDGLVIDRLQVQRNSDASVAADLRLRRR